MLVRSSVELWRVLDPGREWLFLSHERPGAIDDCDRGEGQNDPVKIISSFSVTHGEAPGGADIGKRRIMLRP